MNHFDDWCLFSVLTNVTLSVYDSREEYLGKVINKMTQDHF